MTKEAINAIFEGVIGTVVVVGAFVLLYFKINDATLLSGMIGTAMGVVLTFYFQSRSNTQVQNGTLSALTQISDRISTAREQAAETAARTVEATAQTVRQQSPISTVSEADQGGHLP